MDIRSALKSQYHAALAMLRQTIELCPDALWDAVADSPGRHWRVAYHTLFFTHLYMQNREADFVPWARHREEANFIATVPYDNHRAPKQCEAYSQADLLEYWQLCNGRVDGSVDALDLDSPQCGFYWYKMSTLEHQLVNIRHIQHHTGALASRLRHRAGIAVGWVGA